MTILAVLGLAASSLASDVLVDNGSWITHPGAGFGGADASVLPFTSGATTFGFGHQVSAGHRISDDFVVPATWTLERVHVYAFQLNSGTSSTITGVNLRIWDGPPGKPGSSVIFGDTTTNRMTSTAFTGVYRVADHLLANTQRPVMRQTVELGGVVLEPGTYWLDWQSSGTLASGPLAPPVTSPGFIPVGNARQYDAFQADWKPATDGGLGINVAIPFILEGTSGGVCYADCEGDGDVDIFDFLCFQGEYAGKSSYSDCEGDGDWDVFDFLCFQSAYSTGC